MQVEESRCHRVIPVTDILMSWFSSGLSDEFRNCVVEYEYYERFISQSSLIIICNLSTVALSTLHHLQLIVRRKITKHLTNHALQVAVLEQQK
jgi:hypothetical protein